jgi:hypothetical protein
VGCIACTDEVVMESTDIYWKGPYAALEAVGIRGRHCCKTPGGAAMLLVGIGADMEAFGSADRLASWVRIPRASGHPVHEHSATDSMMIRPPRSGGDAR